MADPWLSIIGLGEDGLNGLPPASRAALNAAEIVFGAPRHLDLAEVGARGQAWPVPFDIAPVLAERGRRVAVLASGDPFWHGAGGSPGARVICTLRDGDAVGALAGWLTEKGFGASRLAILEALGGPRERIRETPASLYKLTDVAHPVTVAIEALGARALPRASGLPDDLFAHDGQITKRPIRALTLSALAPRPNEHLWDLGAGSGSISVEFCLAAPGATASAVESRADRAANIRENARRFGLDHRLEVVEGASLNLLDTLPDPDVIFIGGGASEDLLTPLWTRMAPGTSLVVNAVTLETEALLTRWHGDKGGRLLRIEISEAGPLGTMRGWDRARPVLQWSVTK